ncbi:hypothetical protein J6590_048809 [Homalodisca vitripennis]|nr:hypothetical protein J6590_048809 [Homalodisca vitripennis]
MLRHYDSLLRFEIFCSKLDGFCVLPELDWLVELDNRNVVIPGPREVLVGYNTVCSEDLAAIFRLGTANLE